MATARLTFRHGKDFWREYRDRIVALAREPEVRRVCDLGGGADPVLTLEEIAEAGVDYEVLDIAADQLAKTPDGYRTVLADATAPDFAEHHGPYDLVVSTFVCEHIPAPEAFHRGVREALAPGGRAMHVFPTLYEPAFLLNRLVPERLTERVLHRVQPGREPEGTNEKFEAYYRWCRGPSPKAAARLEGAGFEVLEYTGYFGHAYFERLPALQHAADRAWAALVRRPVPALTAYAWVLLRRA